MKSLFRSARNQKWFPDADAVNAPEGALLRADNMVPDPEAQLALRPGAKLLYEGKGSKVHSLYSCLLSGRQYRFAGANDRLYKNGVDFGQEFDSQGDIAMGDDAFQAFFARGKVKKKYDGKNFHNWSIKAPEFVATLAAVPAITAEVASFDSGESPAFVVNEQSPNLTPVFVSGHTVLSVTLATNAPAGDLLISGMTLTVLNFTNLDNNNNTVTVTINGVATVLTEEVEWDAATSNDATATSLAAAINALIGVAASAVTNVVTVVVENTALQLTPNTTTARASASKKFTSDQDFFNIAGSVGGNTDLFDMYIWMEEPREVDKITIMFGMGTGPDPFIDDYYYFDFQIGDGGTVDIKDAGSTAAAAYAIYADRVRSALTPNEITEVKSLEQVTQVLKRLGRFAGPRSRERADAQGASPAWTHLSVTRGQFNRIGSTAGRDWKTIRGFKVVFVGKPGTTKVAYFDSAVWTGGGNRSLTGRYRVGYRYVRDFDDRYFELSPISPVTEPIDLTQQALQITIPAAALTDKDPQVNQIWVYIIGGFLDTYYRIAVVSAVIRHGMTIDELTNPAGGPDFEGAGERTRLTSWGFTAGQDAATSDLRFTVNKSELEVLIENETLEPGAVGAPDDIVAVAGPFNSRMIVLTKEGRVYPSNQNNPSSFSLYHHLDLRRYGNPLWMILTGGGVYVGMTKDVIRIAGTGDESEDKVTADLYPEPLHVGNPPVDNAVVTDGNAILYRSADGPMMLTGTSLIPLPAAGTSMLWSGRQRHGVQPLNTVHGRFRFAIDNHVLYMMAPEGDEYDPPVTEPEEVEWAELNGYDEDEDGILSRSGAPTLTREGVPTAIAMRELRTGDGYIEGTVIEMASQFIGLSHVYSNGVISKVDFGLYARGTGSLLVMEKGVEITPEGNPIYLVGDRLRVEVEAGFVYYKKNGVVFYTSQELPQYQLVPDIGIETADASMGPFYLSGNWVLVADGTARIWQYSLVRQQWSRCPYPVRFASLFREPDGALIAGTDGEGQVWELNKGTQDNGQDITYEILTPIDDGGEPLSRKDPQDFQIHADTGGVEGSVYFMKDGVSAPTFVVPFSSQRPDIYRANVIDLGVFLKLQLRIIGTAHRFVLHAFNMMYRNRVPQVMVLDTGTIQPKDHHQMVWLTEVEIDCISPVDLEMDLYLDDRLKTTQPVVVLPNRRSGYRVPLPRGCKAKAPRLVFRTTNSDGVADPGFEPYRVRVKDRQTGNESDQEYRPVWPVGEAP